jgi:hypothetical protein
MGPKATHSQLRGTENGRRAAEAEEEEEEDRPKGWLVKGGGNKGEDKGPNRQAGWAIVFRMVKGQIAE